MQATSIIHSSWNPVLGMLHVEPLKTLRDNILPNVAFNPKRTDIFKAFTLPVNKIKVVIIGQDPYPNPAMATGLAFDIPLGMKKTPSLEVIEKEVLDSDPSNMNPSGEINLSAWFDQGVLLLNSALTVQSGISGSHMSYWQPFMKRVVNFIAVNQPCIWLLWGRHAMSYMANISNGFYADNYDSSNIDQMPFDPSQNHILRASHPMVEKYGSGKFYGCNHFYLTNKILSQRRLDKIKW